MAPSLYSVLAISASTAIMFAAFSLILTPRFSKVITVLIAAAATAAIHVLLGAPPVEPELREIVLLSIQLGLAIVLFRDRLSFKLSALIIMGALALFADMLTWPVIAIFEKQPSRTLLELMVASSDAVYIHVVYWCIFSSLAAIAVAIWRKYVHSRQQFQDAFLLAVAVVVFAQILFLQQIFRAVSADRIDPLTTMLLVCINVLGYILLWCAIRIMHDDAAALGRAAMLKREKQQRQRYMDDLAVYSTSIDSSRRRLYGAIEHLCVLTDYATDADVFRFLDHLEQTSTAHHVLAYSDTLSVSSLVAEKAAAAQAAGASFECRTYLNIVPRLSEFDACTILSNLLDNALAALRYVPTGSRWIRLSLTRKSGLLMLECSNPNISVRESVLQGREHGLGLHIVRDAVCRNGGTMVIDMKDVFRAIVAFPAEPES